MSARQNSRSAGLVDRLKDRHALHMMRHRKDVGLSASRKSPGQRLFLSSPPCVWVPGASNERHSRQSVNRLPKGQLSQRVSLRRIRTPAHVMPRTTVFVATGHDVPSLPAVERPYVDDSPWSGTAGQVHAGEPAGFRRRARDHHARVVVATPLRESRTHQHRRVAHPLHRRPRPGDGCARWSMGHRMRPPAGQLLPVPVHQLATPGVHLPPGRPCQPLHPPSGRPLDAPVAGPEETPPRRSTTVPGRPRSAHPATRPHHGRTRSRPASPAGRTPAPPRPSRAAPPYLDEHQHTLVVTNPRHQLPAPTEPLRVR